MNVRAYTDYQAARCNPEYRRVFVPATSDTVEFPAITVSEGEAAAEEMRRFDQRQRRAWPEWMPR
jgi:hypothetical protein